MAFSVSGSVQSVTKFLHQSTQDMSLTYQGSPARDWQKTFSTTDTTKFYFKTYTITTTPTVVDVTALTDPYGQTVNFATVKHVQIINKDATNSLTAGGGTDPLFSALPNLVGQTGSPENGSCINLTTNLTVSGTTKNIQLVASAGTITVDLLLAGS